MTRKNKTILLVEDEALIAMDEARMLEGYGYAVIIAYSGEEAVAAAKSNPAIDLILMDIDLGPGMDGTGAAEEYIERAAMFPWCFYHPTPNRK